MTVRKDSGAGEESKNFLEAPPPLRSGTEWAATAEAEEERRRKKGKSEGA